MRTKRISSRQVESSRSEKMQIQGTFTMFLITILAASSKVGHSLRISSVEVPAAAMNSTQVTLVCNYELEDEQLYSIKWYKNYVEFYRFQPNELAVGGEPTLEPSNQMQQKQEFELDGINLDLSNSNSSHVHLRQTTLASAGTYKCEVSADSPSFVTVAAEREMKIYGASKPVASLTWLLNDSPIIGSGVFKLTTQHFVAQSSNSKSLVPMTGDAPAGDQLIETRLTLTFRIDAETIKSNRTLPQATKYQNLRLRCLSRLAFEYSTETSVLVSGGKAIIRKRQQLIPQLPSPSSLNGFMHTTHALQDPPDFRWPPSSIRSGEHQFNRMITDSAAEPNSGDSLASYGNDQDQEQVNRSPGRGRHQLVVWTRRQLMAQAEHVDQMLRRYPPNELLLPTIEAATEPESEDSNQEDPYEKERDSPEGELSDSREKNRTKFKIGESKRDYQLNDRINFLCKSKQTSIGDSSKKINLSWIINDKEIATDRVNSFDGFKFYDESGVDSDDTGDSTKTRPKSMTTSELIANHEAIDSIAEISAQKSLQLKLTPKLFQLKELKLKCKATIKQVLLEFESQVIISVPNSQLTILGSSAIPRHKSPSGSSSWTQRPLSGTNRPYGQEQSGNQHKSRNSVIRMRPQQTDSSSSSTTPSFILLLLVLLVPLIDCF